MSQTWVRSWRLVWSSAFGFRRQLCGNRLNPGLQTLRGWSRRLLAALLLCLCDALLAAASPLESVLLKAVQAARFNEVIDFGAGNEAYPVKAHLHLPAARIAHLPNVDVAVIQLDRQGRMVDRAEVLLSRDYPEGVVVPLDPDRGAVGVRFLRWDIERSDGGTFSKDDGRQITKKGWTNDPALTPDDDLVAGRTNVSLQFMAPYPASLFKTMVAFHVLRMADAGKISLDSDFVYNPPGTQADRRPIRDWLEPMITVSDNHAARALLKLLHDKNEISALNREFRDLNLPTLQINATSPSDGAGWSPGQIHMTAFDTARLFWLIDGGAGVFWKGRQGQPVTESVLSDSSRAFFKQLLEAQAFNDALTTANYPGAPNVRAGIPSLVAPRWINPTNGHVCVEGTDYGQDIREVNGRAEVEFLHKTGITFNYGSDAGIVYSLPGHPFRHYIVAFLANLGYRYADAQFSSRTNFPALDRTSPIPYTQKLPTLGRTIDEAIKKFKTDDRIQR